MHTTEDLTVGDFVATQKNLLELELKAEEEEEKSIASSVRNASKNDKSDDDERPSHVLRQLEASEISVGLYGRTMVTLTLMDGKGEALLPAHRFSVGDEVEISKQKQSGNRDNVGGVISTLTETNITIALFGKRTAAGGDDENDEDEEDSFLGAPPLAVIPKSSVEVHRKLIKSLDELQRDGSDHKVAGHVVNALFGPAESFPQRTLTHIEPFNTNLDASQVEAVSFALNSGERPVSLIHGPPGTGKTTTIAELIKQAVYVHKYKVLVCAPSNVAVDNVLERLVADQSPKKQKRSRKERQGRLKAVRLGHPARLKESILPYSLESLVQNADGTEIVSDVRSELQSFLRILSNPKSRGGDKRMAYREIKALRKEVRSREQKVVKDLIREAQVVLATNVGAANYVLTDVQFDLVVIDEAAQALEASCWIPALRGKRLVLAGDHCQLPPTIKSNVSTVQKGLGNTLFQRAMELYGDSNSPEKKGTISRMLKVQYRMHSDIANWASKVMYHGQLETHNSVESRTLSQLPHVQESDADIGGSIGEVRLLLIDTAGCEMYETVNAAGSRYNDGEAQIVAQHVQALLAMGLKQEEIAVISPYNGQVELLRTLLLPDAPKLEIRSVDGFQGGEREAVVLSLVRSSRGGAAGIGFLKDDRRLNVAVTRAKRQCALVCDTETVSQSKFVKGLGDWMEEHGVHRSAAEINLEGDIQAAELELMRMMDIAALSAGSIVKPKPNAQQGGSGGVKSGSADVARRKDSSQDDSMERQWRAGEEERRKGLLDKIAAFTERGQGGDEMRLSPDLSRLDRRVVHEFATQLGLDHRSEGVDGVDRRIILTIKNQVAILQPETTKLNTEEKQEVMESEGASRPTAFSALDIGSDDSSESDSAMVNEEIHKEAPAPMNNVLGDLAKERLHRQQQANKNAGQAKSPTRGGKKKGKKKKKGQKLGSNTRAKASNEEVSTDVLPDDLDDMAFLDAQIERVQASHGRKVAGKGQAYRSIVNGILISKPAPREPEKNQRASSALQAKLKQSQDGRKSKKANKKK